MERRDFLKTAALSLSAATLGGTLGCARVQKAPKAGPGATIRDIKKPLAIAMWDFCWLRRHYRTGGFEDWDRALDELAERGYNAIRIEAFPHLVARNAEGKIQETFKFSRTDWKPLLWGNDASIEVSPRQALLEFLPKCRARGIRVGLSTWMHPDDTGWNMKNSGPEGLARMWGDTLEFLEQNGLLHDIIYVDLLNEYPSVHCYQWLHDQIKAMSEKATDKAPANVDRNLVLPDMKPTDGRVLTLRQRQFINDFANQTITLLKQRWPRMAYMFCQTQSGKAMPWTDLDHSQFGVIDIHYWFSQHPEFMEKTGYWQKLVPMENDQQFQPVYKLIREYWAANKTKMIQWMDEGLAEVASVGRKLGVPYGNTEGWGPVIWLDNPNLDWVWLKETAEICAELGVKHGYHFNCTSNFTHPHFKTLWDDVKWHQRVTKIIRQG